MANVRSTLERIRDRFEPPPGGFERLLARRDRRLRIRRITAATVALALSAGLFAGLWSVMRTTVPPIPRPAGALTVRVGGSPVDVAVSEVGVWVTTVTDPSGRGEVVRIDPSKGRIVARISLPEVGALAVGEGAVWVANLRHETVTRIDPETDEVADIIDMPPLGYEVAEGDAAFLPEGIDVGFGRVWVSTARGSVNSIDPATGEVLEATSDPRAILGGVTTGAGSVWAWNAFEPPETEVWRLSPESGEVVRIPVPNTVLDAAAGSAGLYVLHVETGDVSLIGAGDLRQGPVEHPVPVGSAGERANAIAILDPTVYVAAAAGEVYAIDQGSGDAALLARLPGEPTAVGVSADALWVAAADGTVTEVALEGEVAPEPTALPTPTTTTEEQTGPTEGKVLLGTDAGIEILRSGATTSELVAPGGRALDLSPDGSLVLASIGEELVVIDLSSGDRSVLARATGEDVLGAFARWSPDGSRVAYSVGAPDPQKRSMVCMVAVASGTTRCFPEAGRVYTFDWAPDGRTVVVAGPPQQPVRTVDVVTGEVAVVMAQVGDTPINAATKEAGYGESFQLVHPRWSPSGRYLAALANLQDSEFAYVPVIFTPQGEFVTFGRPSGQFPKPFAWSPIEDVLAYTRGEAYRITEAFILDVATGADSPLVRPGEPNAPAITGLAWSPTARGIALTAWQSQGEGIFRAILRFVDVATGDSGEIDVDSGEALELVDWGP